MSERKDFRRIKGAEKIDMRQATTKATSLVRLMENWEDLAPRWRAVAMTAQAELHDETWIDAKFTGHANADLHEAYLYHHNFDVRGGEMTPTEMGKYKYQIDFGGGGGTAFFHHHCASESIHMFVHPTHLRSATQAPVGVEH